MNPIILESPEDYLTFAAFADLVRRDRNVAIDRHRSDGVLVVRYTSPPAFGSRLAGLGAVPDVFSDDWERILEYKSKEYPA